MSTIEDLVSESFKQRLSIVGISHQYSNCSVFHTQCTSVKVIQDAINPISKCVV